MSDQVQVTGNVGRNIAPLVLRLAVAGILGYGGLRTCGLLPTDAPQPEPVAAPQPSPELEGDQGIVDQALQDAVERQKEEAAPVDISDDGKVTVGWTQLMGGLEITFAIVLLFGFLTRFAALAGLSVVTLTVLQFHDVVNLPWFDRLASVYGASSLATLLLGAVCLSLLVSGAGPLSLDRVMWGRNRPAPLPEPTPPARRP